MPTAIEPEEVIRALSGRSLLFGAHVSGIVSGAVYRIVYGVVHAYDPVEGTEHARHCTSKGIVPAGRHKGDERMDSEMNGSAARRGEGRSAHEVAVSHERHTRDGNGRDDRLYELAARITERDRASVDSFTFHRRHLVFDFN